ncbi:MAG: hypothetical protein ACI97A_002837 [Planctomycetota bacterium]|jgi:hypothetical protein
MPIRKTGSHQGGLALGKFAPIIVVIFIALVAYVGWSFLDASGEGELEDTQFEDTQIDDRTRASRTSNRPKVPNASDVAANGSDASKVTFENTDDFDESNSVLVNAINRSTGEPLPDVTIHILQPTAKQLATSLPQFDTNFIFEFRNKGTHFQADDEGKVRIPDSKAPFWLAAESGQSFAKMYVEPPFSGKLTLEMEPVLTLKVRVFDAQSEPVKSIRVGLGFLFEESGKRSSSAGFAAFTNAEGIAYLALIGEEINPDKFADAFNEKPRLCVQVDGVFRTPVHQEIDFDSWPTEVIELTIPSTSMVNVKVEDIDGSAYTDELHCYARAKKPGTKSSKNPRWDFSTPFRGGTCQIPDIGTGLNLLIRIAPPADSAFFDVEKEVQVDESLSVTIRFKKRLPVITGRLLDPEGSPIKNREISYYNQLNYKTNDLVDAGTTTPSGKFAIPVKWTYFQSEQDEFLVIQTPPTDSRPPLLARVSLPRKPITEDLDVGDVSATVFEQLIGGVVRDLSGEPIIGVQIEVELDPLRPIPNGFLRTQKFGLPLTDRSGRFVVYGETNADFFQVKTTAVGYRTKSELGTKGDSTMEITLSKGASVSGTISFSNGTSSRRLGIGLENLKDKSRLFTIIGSGPYSFVGLDPGQYRVTISGADLGTTKNVVVGEFELAPEEEKDLGSHEIPFEGSRVQFVFSDAKNSPSIFEISVCNPNTKEAVTKLFVHTLREEAFLPISPCDLIIRAEGFRSKTIRSFTGGKLNLELSQGIPFKFSLKNFDDVPEDLEVNFYVETGKGETLLWLKDLAVPARHYFRQAGDFKIVAAISKKSDVAGNAVKVDVIPATMKVTETEREKPMSLRLDTEVLQQAVSKLKK